MGTKKTEDLIKVALKKEPIYIGIEEKNKDSLATVAGLSRAMSFVLVRRDSYFSSPSLRRIGIKRSWFSSLPVCQLNIITSS